LEYFPNFRSVVVSAAHPTPVAALSTYDYANVLTTEKISVYIFSANDCDISYQRLLALPRWGRQAVYHIVWPLLLFFK